MLRRTSAAISPTALYTGTVWLKNGLSHPAFGTLAGNALWTSLLAPRRTLELLGAPHLDAMLLARHHAIDTVLEEAIDRGEITQVVELAAGLSPRGWRFATRHGSQLTYVETDLPGMSRRKSELLEEAGLTSPGHRVRVLDAFAAGGPDSLAALMDELDPTTGTAVITEGLINYFPTSDVVRLWGSIATNLRRFPRGLYLSDLHLDRDQDAAARTAKAIISLFVRGDVYPHFADEDEALQTLRSAGFDEAELLLPSSFADRAEEGIDRNLIVRAWSAA